MSKKIHVLEHSQKILNALSKGILLTTKADNKVDSMVISWGMLGIEWNKPIFTIFIREHRFTRSQLDKNPEFSLNIPDGIIDKNIMKICGTQSGHDIDKIKELNLTLLDGEMISVPAIKELPITLECKVIYKQPQVLSHIPHEYLNRFYPDNVDVTYHGENKDLHIAYYGEIVNAYIIE